MRRAAGGDDPEESEASATARSCIEDRIALWDAIAADLHT